MFNRLHLALWVMTAFGTGQAFSRDQQILREDFADVPAHWPVEEADIVHPQLDLRLAGDAVEMLKLSFHPEIEDDPHYLWSGQCRGLWACWFDLKQAMSFERKGLSLKLRTKQAKRDLHLLIKTSDGNFASKKPVAIPLEKPQWNEQSVLISELSWRKFDPKTLRPGESDSVDLSSIQAIGFTDFQASEGSNACSRLDWFAFIEPKPDFFEVGHNHYRTGLDISSFAGDGKTDEIPRALLIRLSDQIWAAFDPDLLRLATVWKTPENAVSPVTLETMAQVSFPDVKAKARELPRPIGHPLLYFPRRPQLSFERSPVFMDVRSSVDSRNVKVGPLPLNIGRWVGVEQLRDGKIELCYRVGKVFVRERIELDHGKTGVILKRIFSYGGERRLPVTAITDPGKFQLELKRIRTNGPVGGAAMDGTNISLLRIQLAGVNHFSTEQMSRVPPLNCTTYKSAGVVHQDYLLKEVFMPFPFQCSRPIRAANLQFTSQGAAYLTTLDGDVWRITDLDTGTPHWLRVAQGIYEPMGLEITERGIFVFGRDQITELIDKDGDHIIDYYRCFSDQVIQSAHTRDYSTSIASAPDGGFVVAKGGIIYYNVHVMVTDHRGSVLKVSADGSKAERLVDGLRIPYVGHGADGEYLVSDQQGHYIPSTPLHRLTKDAYYGFEPTNHRKREKIDEPLIWFSYRDNQSGASFVKPFGERDGVDSMFGELPVHLSWSGYLYYIQTGGPENVSAPFAARMPFRTDFPVLGGDYHPANAHLFATGLGIASFLPPTKKSVGVLELSTIGRPLAVRRIRWNENVLTLSFNRSVENRDRTEASLEFEIEGWNYRRTKDYGSGNYLPDGRPGKLALYPNVKLVGPQAMLTFPYLPRLQQLTIAWKYLSGSSSERSGLLQLRSPGSKNHMEEISNKANGNSMTKKDTNIDGAKVFRTHNCATCHAQQGVGLIGPSLKGLGRSVRTILRNGKEVENIKADAAYLRRSILKPNEEIVKGYVAAMPSYNGVLNEEELNALIEYLNGL